MSEKLNLAAPNPNVVQRVASEWVRLSSNGMLNYDTYPPTAKRRAQEMAAQVTVTVRDVVIYDVLEAMLTQVINERDLIDDTQSSQYLTTERLVRWLTDLQAAYK